MTPWTRCQAFTISFDEPWDVRYDPIAGPVLDSARLLLAAIRKEIPPAAVHLAGLVNLRTGWRFGPEFKAAAQHAGVEWEWLLLANISYDLAMSQIGCSTMALATPEGPLLARNLDWWPERLLAGASCLLHITKAGAPAFTIAGWPGSIGVVSGCSPRGFALTLNAAASDEGVSKTGYPVLLFLRKVIEDASGFDEAVSLLAEQPLAAGALVTVVGVRNDQRVLIERTPTRAVCRRPDGSGPLLVTNHYRALGAQGDIRDDVSQYMDVTCGRYDSLARLASSLPTDSVPSAETLLTILSDPGVMQTITAQQMIFQPSLARAELYVPQRLLDPA